MAVIRYGGGGRFSGKAEKGKENPFSCVVLHGGRQHAERKRNLAAFKASAVAPLHTAFSLSLSLSLSLSRARSET